jgi:hypothetical protein
MLKGMVWKEGEIWLGLGLVNGGWKMGFDKIGVRRGS